MPLDIGPGDEVITQTNTFIATAQTTFNLFALPVFVDSDPETFMINADKIEERITTKYEGYSSCSYWRGSSGYGQDNGNCQKT